MKKALIMMGLTLFFGLNKGAAQSALDKLSKQTQTSVNNAQSSSTKSILGNLDAELKKKFKLDGVKSEIVGNTLKMKVADGDFAGLSSASRTKQGNDILGSALGMLSGSGLNLKSMGISKVVLDMVKGMNVGDILGTVTKKL